MVKLPVGIHLKVVFEGFHDSRSFQLGLIFQSVYLHVSHGSHIAQFSRQKHGSATKTWFIIGKFMLYK